MVAVADDIDPCMHLQEICSSNLLKMKEIMWDT